MTLNEKDRCGNRNIFLKDDDVAVILKTLKIY